MSSYALRPARLEDADAIARIWYDGWRDGHLGHVSDDLVAVRTAESFRQRAPLRIGDTVVAVTGPGREVAGFVMVVDDEVEQVYVAARHRGRGVAAMLVGEAERRVAAGYPQAWLAVVPGNARARRCYERCGWTDEGPFTYAAAAFVGTITVPAHRYVKTL